VYKENIINLLKEFDIDYAEYKRLCRKFGIEEDEKVKAIYSYLTYFCEQLLKK
jgi:hypothetical protein